MIRQFVKALLPQSVITHLRLNRKAALYRQVVQRGDLVFDIGANHGNRVELFLHLGARVVAVEPQAACCAHLRQLYGNRITLIEKGASSQAEVRQLHLCTADTLATFDPTFISTLGETRFREEDGVHWEGTAEVNMTTLDALVAEYGEPSFIKIDVEGFELEVLKGLTKPVKMLSFEYTVPERAAQLLACLRRIAEINPQAECNYSVSENLIWALPQWESIDALLKRVETPTFLATDFGDIYVRRRA